MMVTISERRSARSLPRAFATTISPQSSPAYIPSANAEVKDFILLLLCFRCESEAAIPIHPDYDHEEN